MQADKDSQFHFDPSPKKRLKNEGTTTTTKNTKTYVVFVRRRVTTSSVQPKSGKNTFSCMQNWAEDDVYRRLKDSEALEETNVTLR